MVWQEVQQRKRVERECLLLFAEDFVLQIIQFQLDQQLRFDELAQAGVKRSHAVVLVGVLLMYAVSGVIE